jgi:hypothetical protein
VDKCLAAAHIFLCKVADGVGDLYQFFPGAGGWYYHWKGRVLTLHQQLSEADRLNGVTYRVNVRLACKAVRVYSQGRWHDWAACGPDGQDVCLAEQRGSTWSTIYGPVNASMTANPVGGCAAIPPG